MGILRRKMSQQSALRNTICSKGHTHPPWNTSGVLRIAKCESVCGFCQKETKTAANLRKHVAIHIKNERLKLTIAEGSSGRGRLEMPTPLSHVSTSRITPASPEEMDTDPTPSILTAMSQGQLLPKPSSTISDFSPSQTLLSIQRSSESSPSSSRTYLSAPPRPQSIPSPIYPPQVSWLPAPNEPDHFRNLRKHNLSTKEAWTAIPAAEGFKILDLCRSLSSTSTSSPPVPPSSSSSSTPVDGRIETRVPCYNRETIFDEEWQAHMKNVHGVFLLWPETWMRRIEVLDLDAFGGDIAVANDVIMDN